MIKAIIFDWTGTLYERNKGLFDFSIDVLNGVRNKYRLGLVSKSRDVESRRRELEGSGIIDYFWSIIVSESKGIGELEQSISELGVNPEQVLVVGDRASREIHAGNLLGCETTWIMYGDRSYDSPNEETGEPTYRIDSIKDLPEILK